MKYRPDCFNFQPTKDKAELGSDLDAHVIECYQIQCRAEAQEVTIARAVTLNHKPKLIAALAKDTKDFFEEADKQLAAIKNEPVVGKWRKVSYQNYIFTKKSIRKFQNVNLLAEMLKGKIYNQIDKK